MSAHIAHTRAYVETNEMEVDSMNDERQTCMFQQHKYCNVHTHTHCAHGWANRIGRMHCICWHARIFLTISHTTIYNIVLLFATHTQIRLAQKNEDRNQIVSIMAVFFLQNHTCSAPNIYISFSNNRKIHRKNVLCLVHSS